ncbi:MAG: tRNA preQ1(34) S-adenosylmethionine ribosyltransferase-isomerase QueA [Ruminococcus sp.]|nr:tRNA preQ1(34) S-adenosylmethionine ribosyltransferase-isomerase QueA [Ruminococcus sp.]
MKTSDFYYDLPKELIAQTPLEPRDSSRLLVLGRDNGKIEHKHFYDIIDYLNPGDCLIANDSRVLPARIFGTKKDTGANVEFLLLTQIKGNQWETLCKPGKKAKVGAKFDFGNGLMTATVVDVKDDGNRIVEFDCDENFFATLDKIGQMPLPPYITEKLEDKERYQTVYSNELGSAAAPTAGLHFTNELMARIKAKGVKIAYVTLHVGLGTFRPVKVDDVTNHKMHSEHYEVPDETAKIIKETKENGGRVIAVGTTSCRTLESVATQFGEIKAADGWTDIFIYPGYKFKVLDGLITNFHLPESTLIMLVSAFAGYDNIMKAYKTAVDEQYRFFSFGDAMAIL